MTEKKEDIVEIKTNLNIHQKLLIEDYLDKSFIMSILCEETKNYYYNIRNMLQLPTIILPSILCVFNAANGSIPLEKHYILMKNELANTIEKKVFCFIMDLPESNSNKKIESKMKDHPIDDHYSF